jgi:hypothetical protein
MVGAISLLLSSPAVLSSSPLPPNLLCVFVPQSRSNLSLLCFHNLTNPFSRKPFDFTSKQIPRGCAPFSLFSVSVSLWRSKFVALCFHILTNCFSRKSFVLTTIRIAPGCGGQIRELPPFFSVRSVSRWQIHSFHTIANSLSSRKNSSALESGTSGLFCKNTRGGVGESVPAALFAEDNERSAKPFQFRNRYLREPTLC